MKLFLFLFFLSCNADHSYYCLRDLNLTRCIRIFISRRIFWIEKYDEKRIEELRKIYKIEYGVCDATNNKFFYLINFEDGVMSFKINDHFVLTERKIVFLRCFLRSSHMNDEQHFAKLNENTTKFNFKIK